MQKCIAMALFIYRKEIQLLLKMIFDIEKYKGKYVMHCKTEAESNSFCRYLDSIGRKWCDGWKYFGKETCYCFNDGKCSYKGYYISNGYIILEWGNYIASDICNSEIREIENTLANVKKMVDCKFPVDKKYVVELTFYFLSQLEKIYEIFDKETVQKEYVMTFSTINVIFIEFFESPQEILSEDATKEYFEKIKSYENKNMYLPYTFLKFVRCNYEKFCSDG